VQAFHESNERWTITGLHGREVTMCNIDYAFTLVFWALDQPGAELRVEMPFELSEPDGRRWQLDPERSRRDLGPAIDCFGKTVSQLFVDRQDGRLDLAFSDGTRLAVEPHPKFEAWGLTGPGTLKLVCMPGGGEPAIWV
jgi:Family of unknown function (DUF6188)